ncbi:hypothetical protein COU54_03205 [Candidatus Pacearchaeota archaeon CG10_big_fil_rev_8_21_14_0_10_31_24]|nr:MAG: hypothetical protein COU54_03205 [Candidatus Pacearchaeota archaeon CG10_big_fil_rev_8_21_14_0_10_31_24]
MFERGKALTRLDIESKLRNVGNYVKMNYLQECLKQRLDLDTKRFVSLKLAEMYGERGMHLNAAKLMSNAAEISSTYTSKINDFMRAVSFFVKGNNVQEAEIAFGKALACGNEVEKRVMKSSRKEIYLNHAQELMKKEKRSSAVILYEHYLRFDINASEKLEVQKILLSLYQRLGKMNEYNNLKSKIN